MKEVQPPHRGSAAWVIYLAWLCAFLPLALIIFSGMKGTQGLFTYPVDDTYIHLKIAQNLAEQGNWGINPGEFNSASSSILYTILLAGLLKIFPGAVLLPLIINAIAGTILLILIWKWLTRQGFRPASQFLILLLIIFFVPLPVLMLSGMEHVLQCIFAFLFISGFLNWSKNNFQGKLPGYLLLYAILLVLTRYEGLFIIAGACVVLLSKRRLTNSILLGSVSLFPVILFGIISIIKGSYFLPNSLLVKSEAIQFSISGISRSFNQILVEKFMFAKAGITLLATQRLLLLLPLVFLLFRRKLSSAPAWPNVLIILMIAVFLQLVLADTGKFYRYEASLVLLSVLMIAMIMVSFGKELWEQISKLEKVLGILVLSFIIFPLVLRSMAGFTKAPGAIVNIHDQQYQMGKFLQQYFPDDAIAANDIGAISYLRTNGKIVDLWGLATLEIAKSKKGGYWNGAFLDSISRKKGAKMAIVYESWIGKSLPASWEKIATWRIRDNVVAGDDIVSFYAIDPLLSRQLDQQLREYQKQLPATVRVDYY